MKVYILFGNPFPYGMATSQHVTCEALGLVKAGADVEVIVYNPCLTTNDDISIAASGIYKGISYKYLHGRVRSKYYILAKLMLFINAFRTFLWGLKVFKRNDIVYCYEENNLVLSLFCIAAKFKSSIAVREMVEIPFFGESKVERLRRWANTRFVIPHFDAFVCISHALSDFVSKYKSSKASILLQPILVEEIQADAFNYKPYDVPYIIHTGTMYERKDGISYILKAFAEFKKKDKSHCRLVFTGPQSKPESCLWIPLIKELGIENFVDLLGIIPKREDLLSLQHNASLSIVYKCDNIQTRYCFATKMGEIMMAGVPLITTTNGEQKYYLRNNDNALLVDEGNIIALSDAIKYIIDNPEKASLLTENARTIALSDFNPTFLGIKLYDYFKTLRRI